MNSNNQSVQSQRESKITLQQNRDNYPIQQIKKDEIYVEENVHTQTNVSEISNKKDSERKEEKLKNVGDLNIKVLNSNSIFGNQFSSSEFKSPPQSQFFSNPSSPNNGVLSSQNQDKTGVEYKAIRPMTASLGAPKDKK